MAKLSLFVFLFALNWAPGALAFALEYLGEANLDAKLEFQNTRVGGLSALAYDNGFIFAVSDDRGKYGDPRVYKIKFDLEKKKVSLKLESVIFVKGLPKTEEKPTSLDLEGLVLLGNKNFLLSSEGSNNSKPRQKPSIFEISKEGTWLKDISIPAAFLPESTGQQTKGIQNNFGFEGLSISPSQKSLFAAAEAPLQQDLEFTAEETRLITRVVKYETTTAGAWVLKAQYAYQVESYSQNSLGTEVFRGVSEVLALSDTKLLVLERGVRLFGKGIMNTSSALYEADFSAATDIQNRLKLSVPAFVPAAKKRVLDLEIDLKGPRKGKKVQNFEALAWGPTLSDGRKTIIVLSDNNFSKSDDTEFLVFAVSN